MNNREIITFTLKTTSIDPSLIYTDYFGNTILTTTGIVSNNRCNYTWYNVNLRNIIGNDTYEKYNKFNISLNTVAMSSQGSSTVMTPDARNLYIKMNGLPWLSSYDTTNPTTYANLNVIEIPTTASTTYLNNINNPQILTFLKSVDNVNINIVLHSIQLNNFDNYADATQLLGHFAFLFSITPVIEDDINVTKDRMFIR